MGKIISEWRQYRDIAVVSICQGKEAEFVEYGPPVGNGGKKPAEIVLADTLGRESGESEKVTGVGTEFAERRR